MASRIARAILGQRHVGEDREGQTDRAADPNLITRGQEAGAARLLSRAMRRRRASVIAIAAALVAAGIVILWLGRSWSFFYDDWGTILYRRAGGAGAFLAPHNGHLEAVQIALYRALFALVGLRHHFWFEFALVCVHLVAGALLFVYAARRLPPVAALVLTLSFLFAGQAWEVLFWSYSIGFVVPVAALVGILLVNDARVSRRALATFALALVALLSSGIGLVALVVAGVDALLAAERRRRRIVPVAAAALIYAAWFALYRPGAQTPRSLRALPGADPNGDVGVPPSASANAHRLTTWVWNSAKAAFNAVIGSGPHGVVVPLALIVALVLVVVRRRTLNGRLVALSSGLLFLWLVTGLTRSQIEAAPQSRYFYPAVALVLLIAAEAARGLRLPRAAVVALALLAAIVLVRNVDTMRDIHRFSVLAFARQDASLARMEHCRRLPPGYAADPVQMPGVKTGPYRAAVHDLGSPIAHVAGGRCP